MQYSQEHLKTKVYAEFGGQTECIMGNSKIENYFHSKISSYASFIHKNCSGQLLSAYFLFSRLPFAVNVNLLFLEFLMLGMMYTQLAGEVT